MTGGGGGGGGRAVVKEVWRSEKGAKEMIYSRTLPLVTCESFFLWQKLFGMFGCGQVTWEVLEQMLMCSWHCTGTKARLMKYSLVMPLITLNKDSSTSLRLALVNRFSYCSSKCSFLLDSSNSFALINLLLHWNKTNEDIVFLIIVQFSVHYVQLLGWADQCWEAIQAEDTTWQLKGVFWLAFGKGKSINQPTNQ